MRPLLEPARARATALLGPASERALSFADHRRIATLAIVALVSWTFGFAINAAGAIILTLRGDPLALEYRHTLEFTSGLIGDGILLPLVNVLIVHQLLEWRRAVRPREVVGPVLLALVVTLAAHAYQGANQLLNWTMPQPFYWTVLGYTHALFMWAQLSLLAFFWSQAALIARLAPRAALGPRPLLVLLCMIVFLRLLLVDYGYLI